MTLSIPYKSSSSSSAWSSRKKQIMWQNCWWWRLVFNFQQNTLIARTVQIIDGRREWLLVIQQQQYTKFSQSVCMMGISWRTGHRSAFEARDDEIHYFYLILLCLRGVCADKERGAIDGFTFISWHSVVFFFSLFSWKRTTVKFLIRTYVPIFLSVTSGFDCRVSHPHQRARPRVQYVRNLLAAESENDAKIRRPVKGRWSKKKACASRSKEGGTLSLTILICSIIKKVHTHK